MLGQHLQLAEDQGLTTARGRARHGYVTGWETLDLPTGAWVGATLTRRGRRQHVRRELRASLERLAAYVVELHLRRRRVTVQ